MLPGALTRELRYELLPDFIPDMNSHPTHVAPNVYDGVCAALENQYPPFSKEFLGFDMNQDLKVLLTMN